MQQSAAQSLLHYVHTDSDKTVLAAGLPEHQLQCNILWYVPCMCLSTMLRRTSATAPMQMLRMCLCFNVLS